MIAGATCPVCSAANGPGAVWCVDCGFKMDSTPGSPAEAQEGFRLLSESESYPLKRGANVVGRIQADVFLSDPSVSRRHAVITVSDAGVTVRDEGSSNGTRVGATTVVSGEDTAVAPGQSVQFGTVVLRLSGPDGMPVAPPADEVASEAMVVGHLEGEGVSCSIRAGSNSIGRKPGNDVVLADPFVSGFHAVLTIEPERAFIVDSGSSNGTFIDERRLSPGVEESVGPEQEIRFGRLALRYVPAVAEEAAPDDSGQ